MSEEEPTVPQIRKLLHFARNRVTVTSEELIRTGYIAQPSTLPIVFEPTIPDIDLPDWCISNKARIEAALLKHGAILFRGFNINTVADFGKLVQAISGDALAYCERSSPRSQMSNGIYTSTDYPASESIFPHNELSYARTFPLKLYFFCMTPAAQRGETPLVDVRRVLQRIDPQIVASFRMKKWMYVRNIGDGFGLSLETVFQTDKRTAIEEYCRRNGIEFAWTGERSIRTCQVREAVIRHPKTGELAWFNHITFFHVSTLAPALQEELLAQFDENDLPNNTYYGDGSAIEPWVLDALRDAYKSEMFLFPWAKGDVLLIDNLTTAHAREPFVGERQILFSMSEPHTRLGS